MGADLKKPVDMKVSERHLYGELAVPSNRSGKKQVYPYGLEIRLDSAVLDKLGIKDLPDVDTECLLNGVAVVTEVRKSANGGDKTRHLTLQITKLAVGCAEDGDKAFKRGFDKGPKRK